MPVVSRDFYTEAADALTGFLPRALRDAHRLVTGRNLKVWFDEPREHYEIQTIVSRRVPKLEIGFHAEHRTVEQNDATLERLLGRERSWRKALAEADAGPFLGTSRPWRRISEVWDETPPDEPGAAVEAAERLAAYIKAFEPLRRSR
jgi:hypothetical protein